MRFRILLSISILSLYGSLIFSQQNVMESYNGDFEAGTMDYWRFVEVADVRAGSYAEITKNSFFGNYATQVTWKAGAEGIIDLVLDNWSEGVEVIAGQSYTLKAAVKAVEGIGLRLHVTLGFFNSAGNVINESTADWVLGDYYSEEQHTGIAPAGAVNCWLAFRLFGSNTRWPVSTGITRIDEVQLWTEPTEINSINNNFDNDFHIYPNPVGDKLNVSSNIEIISISVFNIYGQLIKTVQENFTNIYFGDILPGIYIVNLKSINGNIIKTVIKN